MNYPIWELTELGGGTLVAVISILHVYISHLAVGGGAFIWLTDLKASRSKDTALLDYVRKHTAFFLLLTMVFGGVSGVGIWFIIALVNPAATSILIHNFVFGWAIEWVFFVGEIVALLLYHYNFKRLGDRERHIIAFFYFLFAWLSLAVINGILAFMLTPGRWVETGSFRDGILNPTYLPQLLFRTAVTAMVAGLFGTVTAMLEADRDFRIRLLRYCARWLILAVPFMAVFGYWYFSAVPEAVRETTLSNPQTLLPVQVMLGATAAIFVGGALINLRLPRALQVAVTAMLVVIGLGWMGGFEYSREIARKPYVLGEVLYSTSIFKKDAASLNAQGVLPSAKWSAVKDTTDTAAAGRELFNLQCLSCHTVGGVRNDVVPKIAGFPYMGILAQLTGQGKVQSYMPPFVGTDAEREALAVYLTEDINQMTVQRHPEPYRAPKLSDTEIPPFDKDTAEYVLLAWNDLGMHCISDCDPWFVILPPANTLEAQLIRREKIPKVVTEGVILSYAPEPGFDHPEAHSKFWKYAKQNFGADLKPGIGLAGKGVRGTMDRDKSGLSFRADAIPVVPYPDNGTYNPYPLFTVSAADEKSGAVLAETKVVLPTSTEMGCRNCHGGDWALGNAAGVSDQTAVNILKAHDRLSGTTLLPDAKSGRPRLCQSCHADPALGAAGKPEHLNLSAALHGFHANYMFAEGSDACALCHPANKAGSTRCLRGLHDTVGNGCTDCHGELQDHALGLLRGREGKKSAPKLMRHLRPTKIASQEDVNPRTPWLNEPDCLTCHQKYQAPSEGASSFNVWTDGPEALYRKRTGEQRFVRCEACHGSPHAIYPAQNPLAANRDNVQPMQLSGMPLPIGTHLSCELCHKLRPEESLHHPNIERPVRNEKLRALATPFPKPAEPLPPSAPSESSEE